MTLFRLLLSMLMVALPTATLADWLGTPFQISPMTTVGESPGVPRIGWNGEVVAPYFAGGAYLKRYSPEFSAYYSDEYFGTMGLYGVDRLGNVVVVRTYGSGGSRYGRISIYSRSGSLLVPEFAYTSTSTGDRPPTAIYVAPDGTFVVAWVWFGSGTSASYSAYARRFNANGTPITGEITVATFTGFGIDAPSVAADAAGNFAVTWVKRTTLATNPDDVFVNRYTSTGSLIQANLSIATTTSGTQNFPQIAMAASGQFIAAWETVVGSNMRIAAQRFTASGGKVGSEFIVPTNLTGDNQYLPEPMITDEGHFAIGWVVQTMTGQRLPVIRYYDNTGAALGSEQQLAMPAGTTSDLYYPRFSMSPSGRGVVFFAPKFSTGLYHAYAQRFLHASEPSVSLLTSGQTVSGLGASGGAWKHYHVNIPIGVTALVVTLSGSNGNGDLYFRSGAFPSTSKYEIHPGIVGTNETVSISNPPIGDYYFGIYAATAYSGASLSATYY